MTTPTWDTCILIMFRSVNPSGMCKVSELPAARSLSVIATDDPAAENRNRLPLNVPTLTTSLKVRFRTPLSRSKLYDVRVGGVVSAVNRLTRIPVTVGRILVPLVSTTAPLMMERKDVLLLTARPSCSCSCAMSSIARAMMWIEDG